MSEYSDFCDDKIAMYEGMKELNEKAEDLINERISQLDHEPTSDELDEIQNEVWTSLQAKE